LEAGAGKTWLTFTGRVGIAVADRARDRYPRSEQREKEEAMEFSELVQRFAAAAASGDGDALADLFTADGTYDDYFFGPNSGREAIKKMLAHFSDGGRNFRWEFHDPVRVGNVGYASYRFSFDATRPEAQGARVAFDGIGRFDLEGDRIKYYSEVFDRGMALAQQAYEGERLRKIGLKYAAALKARPEWQAHL
jgi:limonene-1,2-epoxide hydrolase